MGCDVCGPAQFPHSVFGLLYCLDQINWKGSAPATCSLILNHGVLHAYQPMESQNVVFDVGQPILDDVCEIMSPVSASLARWCEKLQTEGKLTFRIL
jgi:hypothetical protein